MRAIGLLALSMGLLACTRGPQEAPPHAVLGKCDASAPVPVALDAAVLIHTAEPPEVPKPPVVHGRRDFSDEEEQDSSRDDHVRTSLDPAHAYELHADTIVTMRRTPCFGPCPLYSVGIRGDGTVHFFGERDTLSLGYRTATLSPAAVQGLLTFLKEKQFHALHNQYGGHKTDNPSAIMMMRRGTAWKSVNHNLSNESEPRLFAIEDEIDRVAGTARWVGKAHSRGGRDRAGPPAITEAEMRRMLGGQLTAIERDCRTKLPTTLSYEVSLGIDPLGYAQSQGGNMMPGRELSNEQQTAAGIALACVEKQLPKLVFPIADVSEQTTLRLRLGR